MIASVLVVFGSDPPSSEARVRAAIGYVGLHRPPDARVIFTGGWPIRSGAPADGRREADLMLLLAREAGLGGYAELAAETGSRSTLENLVNLRAAGLLDGPAFDAGRPLGLVSHAWHLPRIRYLAGKVLGLRGPALLDVPADGPATGVSPRILHAAARLGFLGSSDPVALLRRERRLAGFLGKLGKGAP